jgi:hypothetical protein
VWLLRSLLSLHWFVLAYFAFSAVSVREDAVGVGGMHFQTWGHLSGWSPGVSVAAQVRRDRLEHLKGLYTAYREVLPVGPDQRKAG